MKNINQIILGLFITGTVLLSSCTKNEVTKIALDKDALSLILGQTDSIFANVEYTGDIIPAVTWTSSKPDVAKVSNGEIQALKKGSTLITAQAGTKTASCTVTVNNEIFPVLVKGEIWYYGDIYGSETSNNFLVCLAGAEINMENLSGNDDVMFLEFNTELTVKTNVPSGIYEISDSFQPGTMVPGWVEDNGNPWGTWFFGKTNNDVVDGFVKVTNTNDLNYKFEMNLTDYFGNVITGTYQMSLPYYDLSESQAPVVIKNINLKKQKSFQNNKIKVRISKTRNSL
jgi:hypothetical protein